MSDARTPAMDVQMTAQDVGMLRYFSVSLYSAMLIVDDGYAVYGAASRGWKRLAEKNEAEK